MLPVLSATLHDRTSWPSLVLVTRPISRTIKTTFKFFKPGLMSLIKRGGSWSPFMVEAGRWPRPFPPSRAGAWAWVWVWGAALGALGKGRVESARTECSLMDASLERVWDPPPPPPHPEICPTETADTEP